MNRYRIDGPIPTSTTAHIYGPDGQVIGKIYRADDPESLRFKRFIEAHDEIIDVLSDAAYDYGDQAVNLIEMRALLKRLGQIASAGLVGPSDLIEMRTLLNRLDLLASAGLVEPPDLIEMRALLQRLDVYSDKLNEYEKAKAAEQGGTITREGEAI